MSDPPIDTYARQVAEGIALQLEQGLAPWLRSWRPGERYLPYSPVTGAEFHGINAVWLSAVGQARGFEDTRWLTGTQAAALGGEVKPGERGTTIEYWKWRGIEPELDADGRPIVGDDGQIQTRTLEYERPRLWRATLFNAEQILGLAAAEARESMPDSERYRLAEHILAAGSPDIQYGAGDWASYDVATDRITLPNRDLFETQDQFFAVALRQKAHWSGHPSRLDRDMDHPLGSKAFAGEEFRAGIASLILGDRLGMGHEPGHNAAYVDSWASALRNDPREIFRAASDAEKAVGFLLDRVQEKSQGVAFTDPIQIVSPAVEARMPTENNPSPTVNLADGRVYLAVPYGQKDAAKSLGARWDRGTKAWYAPPGADLAQFERWMSPTSPGVPLVPQDPRNAFAEALRASGFELEDAPVMDGRLQRARVAGDTGAQRSGAYTGYLDGRPSGFIQNHKTGIKTNWTAAAIPELVLDRSALAAEAAEKRKPREIELAKQYQAAAQAAEAEWNAAGDAAGHPYLERKGVQTHGVRQNAGGELLVPVRGPGGELWNLQHIRADGRKGFGKGGRLSGGSFLIGDLETRGPILIAEGMSTGATLHEITGQPVAVAFNAGNLAQVAASYRERFPDHPLVIAGDNDHQLARQTGPDGRPKKNVGMEKTREAADAIQGFALLPAFAETSQGTDWNDFADERGLEAAREIVMDGLRRATLHQQGLRLEILELSQPARTGEVSFHEAAQEIAFEAEHEFDLGF